MDTIEQVILVDEHDNQIGVEEKIKAHKKGIFFHRKGKHHRAFSIYIFNNNGELLLQQRAPEKYHSGNLWSNSCCGHPRPGESTNRAAHRRLRGELLFDCNLEEILEFTYTADVGSGLVENEYLHVFVGIYDKPLNLIKGNANINEVADVRFVSMEKLNNDRDANSSHYAPWLQKTLDSHEREIIQGYIKMMAMHR